MFAIHFICGRDDGVTLNRLTYDKVAKKFRSGNWDIPIKDAHSLIGGWIYLHPTKAIRSEFGGRILGFEPVNDPDFAHANRIIFSVAKHPAGAGQRWRGKNHGLAHSGGLVPADLAHEKEATDARGP